MKLLFLIIVIIMVLNKFIIVFIFGVWYKFFCFDFVKEKFEYGGYFVVGIILLSVGVELLNLNVIDDVLVLWDVFE